MRRLTSAALLAAALLLVCVGPAGAAPVATNFFYRTWSWTDKPVADGVVSRTWMWGPAAFSDAFLEPYDEAPGGFRLVQYYDKSRMEISDPTADEDEWFVTNGLLATELITGQLQLGADHFEQRSPAAVNVAGDADDADAPTYASFSGLLDDYPARPDQVIDRVLFRDGGVAEFVTNVAIYGVRDAWFVPETNHAVASVFWDFMQSSGTVYGYSLQFGGGGNIEDSLFPNPFYATGYPITDAYWAYVNVGGVQTDVLIQCFERRCLTYTPSNPAGWQVEAGNVGQHYFRWRYGDAPAVEAQPAVRVSELLPGPAYDTEPVAEYVALRNDGAQAADLSGWFIVDQQGDDLYQFGAVVLQPGAELRLYSCDVPAGVDALTTGDCVDWWQYPDYAALYAPDGRLVSFGYRSGQGGGTYWP
jgi:hypothetical protein